MVAEINDIFADEAIIQDDGWLNLEIAKSVTVNGLDGYALPTLVDRFEYAKRKMNNFINKEILEYSEQHSC